jgi:hypothetical protein
MRQGAMTPPWSPQSRRPNLSACGCWPRNSLALQFVCPCICKRKANPRLRYARTTRCHHVRSCAAAAAALGPSLASVHRTHNVQLQLGKVCNKIVVILSYLVFSFKILVLCYFHFPKQLSLFPIYFCLSPYFLYISLFYFTLLPVHR